MKTVYAPYYVTKLDEDSICFFEVIEILRFKHSHKSPHGRKVYVCLLCNKSFSDSRSLQLHRVSKNVPPLTCCSLYIHGSIAIIFGINVAEKVGNQRVLYLPTSPN